MVCFKASGAHASMSSELGSVAGATQPLEVLHREKKLILVLVEQGKHPFKENRCCGNSNF